jgi:hypothetical protein
MYSKHNNRKDDDDDNDDESKQLPLHAMVYGSETGPAVILA